MAFEFLIMRFPFVTENSMLLAFSLYIFLVEDISYPLLNLVSFYQLVVERMLASEGIKRVEIGRDEFTRKVWQWKEKYDFTSLFVFLQSTLLFFNSQWTTLLKTGKRRG